MKRARLLYPLAAVALVTACNEVPLQPEPAAAPQFTAAAAQAATSLVAEPLYLVNFNGRMPRGFADRVTALGGKVEFTHDGIGLASVSGLSAEAAAELGALEGVGTVMRDPILRLSTRPVIQQLPALDVAPRSVTNPAGAVLFSWQWNMRQIGAHTAWSVGQLGSTDVSVAILDSGIDYDNFDMNGRVDLSRSRSFVASDDAIMDQFLPTRNKIDDLNSHGTNVATQVSSNAIAFAGVNSMTKLIGVKVIGWNGTGSLGGFLFGLLWAADRGADVANLSLGIPDDPITGEPSVNKRANGFFVGLTNQVFNYAYSKGMLVVVAAGNDAANMDNEGVIFRAYCEAPHVICVSATGPATTPETCVAPNTPNDCAFVGPWSDPDVFASYSNFGKAVTVSAPGGTARGLISSLCARRAIAGFQETAPNVFVPVFPCANFILAVGGAGTSQAAPHVAGLAAKLVEKYGKNKPAQIKQALIKQGVDDLGVPGQDPLFGAGRINVAKALGL